MKRHVVQSLGTTDVVTFDLKDARDGTLIIEIPFGSGWYSATHTHRRSSSCSTITTISGQWFVGSALWRQPGPAPAEQAEFWTSFGKLGAKHVEATARLHGTVASRILDDVLCSMVQDAEAYFQLCSTPLWIRALFAVTGSMPRRRDSLNRRLF